MRTSTDRIPTTHVGSLPRPLDLCEMLYARERADPSFDAAALARRAAKAVDETVRRQVATGLDVVSDGEMSKMNYATYVGDRLSGFGGESLAPNALRPRGLPGFSGPAGQIRRDASFRLPMCVGEVATGRGRCAAA